MIIDKAKFFIMCAKRCKKMTEVVKKAGLSMVVLNNINAGRPSKSETVGKLASVLQCQPEELLKL